MTAEPERFAHDWLRLREPADHAARSEALALTAARWLVENGRGGAEIVDLGAGCGSNLRYLAPRLPAGQRWRLIDHDPALLDAATADDPPRDAAGAPVAITPRCADLATDALAALPARGLVTAAALLDLVGADWIERFGRACAAREAGVLIALSVDGRARIREREDRPPDPDDAFVIALLGAHQRRDKGLGTALGTAAPAALEQTLRRAGYSVFTAASDWRLDADRPELAAALTGEWAKAARAQQPSAKARIDAWCERRTQDVRAGRCTITVGHCDLFARPPG